MSSRLQAPRRSYPWLLLIPIIAGILWAAYILHYDRFVDATRYSNRSLAGPAMLLAFTTSTSLLPRVSSHSVFVRFLLWLGITLVSYLVIGGFLLLISLALR
jgi:hypothetical protein